MAIAIDNCVTYRNYVNPTVLSCIFALLIYSVLLFLLWGMLFTIRLQMPEKLPTRLVL